MQLHYPKVALHVPTLLLPRADIPLETWSVIACDQYTSQPEYWEEVRRDCRSRPFDTISGFSRSISRVS